MRFPLALASGLVLLAATCASAQQLTLPLWPHNTPEPTQTAQPETDSGQPVSSFPAGHKAVSLSNVTIPTLTVYPPPHRENRGSAALVFPGGGYQNLAWTKEGTDTCAWLNSIGMTCLLVKYRVPEPHYPESYADLEDAQQAMRLARAHAADWHLDPARIGVIGYSAGGNLAALLSTHSNDHHIDSTPAADDIPGFHGKFNGQIEPTDVTDARPSFTILVYPAYLALNPDQTALDPTYQPSATTPPTFITAAENDKTYGKNSLVYYRALLDAGVPAELHFFPTGGHGFGVYPKGAPAVWIDLAASWLRNLGVAAALPSTAKQESSPASPAATPTAPCPTPAPPTAGRPDPKAGQPTQSTDPNCPTQ